MRLLSSLCLVCLCAVTVAAPPSIDIPKEIQAQGNYLSFIPSTDATAVVYIGMSGVESFPSELLKDSRAFVLPVSGLKEGEYKFSAIAIKDNEYARTTFKVTVGKTVVPEPTPQPKPVDPLDPIKPKPDPKLDDAPVKTDGLYVAFIWESGPNKPLRGTVFDIMFGSKSRGWLDANCEKINESSQYRLIDKDTVTDIEPWSSMLKRKRDSVNWVVVVVGKKYVYEGSLETFKSAEEFTNKLGSYLKVVKNAECVECELLKMKR